MRSLDVATALLVLTTKVGKAKVCMCIYSMPMRSLDVTALTVLLEGEGPVMMRGLSPLSSLV